MAEIVPILEEMFSLKAAGGTVMPPKIFFHRNGRALLQLHGELGAGARLCRMQVAERRSGQYGAWAGLHPGPLHYVGGRDWAARRHHGCKVGDRQIAPLPLPLWPPSISRARTRDTMAILGCGLQGRKNLEALKARLPGLTHCQAYDMVPEREAQFVQEMNGRWGVTVAGAGSAERAVRDADVIITAGPIEDTRRATLMPEWLAPGSLTVTLDYNSYVTDAAIAAMDLVLTDDRGQIEDARLHEGKFTGVTRIDAELADVVSAGQGGGRERMQRILVFNLGIALEDLATGIEILKRARARNIGIRLPPEGGAGLSASSDAFPVVLHG